MLAFIAWNYAVVVLGYAALPRLSRVGWINRLLDRTSLFRSTRRYRAPDVRSRELVHPVEVPPLTEDAGRG